MTTTMRAGLSAARGSQLIVAGLAAAALLALARHPGAAAEAFLAATPVPPSTIAMLDAWVVKAVVQAYAAAANKLVDAGPKPACRLVLGADKVALARVATLTSLTPAARADLARTVTQLAAGLGAVIQQSYCSGKAVASVPALKADLARLAAMF